MERHVKERLVGAAVLMAAAVILIPEMLSGPDGAEMRAAPPARDTALKTYTIDLQQPPEGVAAAELDERAPPPEAPPVDAAEPGAEPQANPQPSERELSASTPAPTPEKKPSTSAEKKPADAPPPTPTRDSPGVAASPPASRPQPPPTAATQQPSRGGSWAVQIGSYAKQSSAERLAGELRTAGHAAFVMPIQSGGATLYRVRVGPMDDRAAAAAALSDLKARFAGAAVVAHP